MQVKYKDRSFSFVARRDFAVAFEYIVCMVLKTQVLQILESLFLFSEESLGINSRARGSYHILELAMPKSKFQDSIRRGCPFQGAKTCSSTCSCKEISQSMHFWL